MINQGKRPIAIIGIGCRFPGGAKNSASFWTSLRNGQNAIVEVPEDRWNLQRFYDPNPQLPGKMTTRWGGFLDTIDQFDAQFFGISPREALRMDPQQRWLLEVAWEALEDGGLAPDQVAGSRTGVFVGISSNDYANIQMKGPQDVDMYTNSGSTLSIASGRISYLFDLKGPSLSVDTACSSALVAVNLACNSIWDGQCDTALAGGVNALLTPDSSIGFSKASMLSPDGRCYTFDERANGYVRGEGAGLIVLKPLDDALEDEDPIYAVIRSSIVNQDGRTSSMTVPGQFSQEAMLNEAYEQAGISPSRVCYIEAHGTGTPVGDPIEVLALGNILSKGRKAEDKCVIGSVKTNIGHLESASGIAGLIKAALVLKYKEIPPNLHFETPNPHIPFEKLKLRVPTKLESIPKGSDPAVVAVNSFGFGGTNAHVVLEEAPVIAKRRKKINKDDAPRPYLVPLSGKGQQSLKKSAENLVDLLSGQSNGTEIFLPDLAHTASLRKGHHDHRLALVACSENEVIVKLNGYLSENKVKGLVEGRAKTENQKEIVFIFTGQGPQWWAMGRELLEKDPLFRKKIEKCDKLLSEYTSWSLVEELSRDEASSRIDDTSVAQPAIFALQIALADWWKARGVSPTCVIGHSVGEVAAAYCSGIYTLNDAIKIIYHRSHLQATTRGSGRMVVVAISPDKAKALIQGFEDQVTISAINSPGLVTLAGDTKVLESIIEPLEKDQVFIRWLDVDYAFHTNKMDPIKDDLLQVLSEIRPRASKIPYYSTVSGEVMDGKKLDASYWWRNIRETVLFGPAIDVIISKDHDLYLELGPHPSHSSSVLECLAHKGKNGSVLPSLRRKESDQQTLLETLATLYTRGYPIQWDALYGKEGQFVQLPSYPWKSERLWLESPVSEEYRFGSIVHPLLGEKVNAPSPTWECELDPRALPYLADHRLHDSMVFPGAAYVEIALAALNELYPNEPFVIEDIKILKGLFMSEDGVITIQMVCDKTDDSFNIFSSTDTTAGEWEIHAQGRYQKLAPRDPGNLAVDQIKDAMEEEIDHAKIYSDFDDVGYQFGPCFREVQKIWRKDGESLAEIQVTDAVLEDMESNFFQPAVLDACFQSGKESRVKDENRKARDNFYMPIALKRVRFFKSPTPRLWCYTQLVSDEGDRVEYDLKVANDDESIIAEIKGFCVQRVDQSETKAEEDLENCYYQFHWHPSSLPGARRDPIELISPERLIEVLDPEIIPTYDKYNLDGYVSDFMPQMETLSFNFILTALRKMGWKPAIGDRVSIDSLIEELGIMEQHHRLLQHSIFETLKKEAVIQATEDGEWEVARTPDSLNLEDLCSALRNNFPHLWAEMDLLIDCGYVLAEVLTGEKDPLDVIFPAGDQKKIESFYKDSSDFQAYNSLLQKAIDKLASELPEKGKLRILEIGSGTGSLTESLLEVLSPDRTEYYFTDISPLFIASAKENFKNYDFIEYSILDIEKPPGEQKFDLQSYDLVLATNVLHATKDLKQTLRHINQLMTEEGLLLFLEVTTKRLFLDLVFGLLPGWWRYSDDELRTTHALITRQEWEGLLNESGFRNVNSFVNTMEESHANQSVFLANASELLTEMDRKEAIDESSDKNKTWLIFADQSGFAESLVNQMEERDSTCIMVTPGESFVEVGERCYQIHPEQLQDMEDLFTHLELDPNALQGIIHMWSLDHPTADITTPESLELAQQTGCLNVLNLIQTLVKSEPDPAPRVWMITHGMQLVSDTDRNERIASAPLIGLARVANNEHWDYHWTAIDLESSSTPLELEFLVNEICSADDELEIAYRGGERFVNRIEKTVKDEIPARTKDAVRRDGVIPYRLEIPTPGILNNLRLNETERSAPGPQEIEIKVAAVGLNFRDVMKVLGMYPGNSRDLKWLGDECSGTVVSVGEEVKNFQVGDEVIGMMVPYCCRSYAIVNEALVFHKPSKQSFEEAATLPIVFLTAHYTLNHLAHLRKGEKILIHAGAGGVGQAAIQMAKHIGAEIFATAGSPEKREFLKSQGIAHVMDDRTLDFADEVMEITEGKGVDVVLNQLAGDFITKSLSVLAPFGRFLEIGKVDIYQNTKIGLEPFKKNLTYFAVDLSKHIEERPEIITMMLQELSVMFEREELKPLPFKAFPITQAVEAFRYFAQSKHIGKNVLSLQEDSILVGLPSEQKTLFRADGTYLITGGLGGFGLEVAKWMVKSGAKNLVLMGRSGASTDDAMEALQTMRNNGAQVVVAKADVVIHDDVERVLNKIDEEMPPLKGVIHAAMVLDDGFLVQIDTEKFKKVLRPKMIGAWHLHQLTQQMHIDFFVLFSSASSMLGPNGQGNYASANFFLDALAHYRNAMGLHALTVNWGALSEAGYVARNENVAKYLDILGLESFTPQEALSIFAQILPKNPVQLGASHVNWKTISKINPQMGSSKLFSLVISQDALSEKTGAHAHSFRPQLLGAAPEDRHKMVENYISEQVAQVFGTSADKIDRDTPLTTIGLDSLMAIELMNRLESNLGINLPMGKFLQGPNISQLAIPVLELLVKSDSGSDTASSPRNVTAGEELMEFPLSQGQRALWFLHRLAPSSAAYNLVFSSRITPYVDIDIMKKAFARIFHSHPMLDIVISTVDGEPMQTLQKGRSVDFREHDATQLSDDELKALLVEHAHKPFNLQTGPVIRLELFRTATGSHVTQLAMHHIVSDAWSIVIVLNELMETYLAIKAGREPDVQPPEFRYSDYVNWQKNLLQSPEADRLGSYWYEYLADSSMVLDLPTDHPRPPVQSFNGATFGFKLEEDLTQKVLKLAEEKRVTLYTTLLSVFNILMHRYCNQEDIIIGSPLSGRINKEFHHITGYFINPVALRSRMGDDPAYFDYLDRVYQSVIGALENQDYPFPLLVDRLKVKRDPSRSPIFQASFSMERTPGVDDQGIAVFLIGQGGHKFNAEDMVIESIDLTLRMAQFEITLVVEEAGGNIYGCWQYNSDLFEPETISRLSGFYKQLLNEIVSHPEKKISEFNLLSADEEKQEIVDWNATASKYPEHLCLHHIISDQSAKTPHSTAISFDGESMTYEELERKSNGLALALHQKGIGPDTPVGLYHERSMNMVVGLLGILKAGGCYVPLDPEFPPLRLEQMLDNANPSVVVTQSELASALPQGQWESIFVEEVSEAETTPQVDGLNPDSLAYIIYTSGSTGVPKGVEISHQSLVNFLYSMQREPGLSDEDKLLAVTTLSFDISGLELYLPLISGAQVILASRKVAADGRQLAALIKSTNPTIIQATPATWQMLLDSGWYGKQNLRILCGGEPLPPDLAEHLCEMGAEVWNLYGPTETTIWSTASQIEKGDDVVSIGRPIANTKIYILDEEEKPLPTGFAGNLYIGGDGLARGYHKQPELTKESFVELSLNQQETERVYKTGDLARYLSDGSIECIGRRDSQIKLRGHRIELSEIETVLRDHPAVKSALVLMRKDMPGGPGIAAYIIPMENNDRLVPDLRSHLTERLPQYMQPSAYMVLDEFPLTPNNKIDRNHLPLPSLKRSDLRTDYLAPQTPTEKILCDILNQAFKSDKIGIHDNFFELGGDSLMAVEILSSITSAFNRELPIEVFLRNPTVESLGYYFELTPENIEVNSSPHKNGDSKVNNIDDLFKSSYLDIEHVNGKNGDRTKFPEVDAVALAYIPDAFLPLTGLSKDEISRQWFQHQPFVSNYYETPFGKIAIVMLPRLGAELYKDQVPLGDNILSSLKLAADMGASTVSLTGLIPSATDYGRSISHWINGHDNLPAITTGHATTTATIVKTITGMLEQTMRDFSEEKIAIVGLGSIGYATLRLMLEVMPHPVELILCDLYRKADILENIRSELIEKVGFKGAIRVVTTRGQLPDAIYDASFVLGASNVPGILDINRLRPGTLLVDDSFPPCFRLTDAIRRIEEEQDILFTTGGLLRCSEEIKETIYLPDGAGELFSKLGVDKVQRLAGRDPREITGCILSSLLTGHEPNISTTIGPVEIKDSLAHYKLLEKLGLESARPQCEGFFIDDVIIERFKKRNGSHTVQTESV